ncbi:MAG: prepilin-type N-terminal cleavage/methylation domain-containing protein [Gemmatimonadales bacterium]
MKRAPAGFTLVEVLVAVVVLGVGIVALAGASAMTTRMIGQGQISTRASQVASRRMEALRAAAYSTTPSCTSPAFAGGGPLTTDGITASWVAPATGSARNVSVTVSYPTPRGTRLQQLRTVLPC